MKKSMWIIMLITLAISAALFQEELVRIFGGMGPLETMQAIAGFVLHYLWVTILGFTVTLVPELIGPWLKTFKKKQRDIRRGRHVGQWQSGPNAYWGKTRSQGPKMSLNEVLRLLPFLQGQGGQSAPKLDLAQFNELEDEESTLEVDL